MTTFDMTGQTAIVTGGAGGVGQTVTLRWLRAGGQVLCVGVSHEELAHVTETWKVEAGSDTEAAARLVVWAADLVTEAGAQGTVAEAERIFGTVDALVHLVGGFGMGPLDAPDAHALWSKMIALNLESAFHCYRAVLPSFKKRNSGSIIGLGSRVAVTPAGGLAAYAASKAGLIALTQALSDEVKNDGVRVNILLASTIDTPANRRAMGDDAANDWVAADDIADACLYLCSPQARAVTGATLEIYARA